MTEMVLPALRPARFRVSLPLISAVFAYAVVMGFGLSGMLGDPDTYWHIATGRWIIANGTVPSQDMFSFSMSRAPWSSPEWLAEVIFASLYDHLGWAGPVLATALSFAAALGILQRALLRYMAPLYALIAVLLAWGVTVSHLLARPHMLVFPILVLWVAGLVNARAENRVPTLWLAPLLALWANLHGSFTFGLGLAGLFAAEALLAASNNDARLAALRGWGLFVAAAFGAALLNPLGINILQLSVELAATGMNKFVLEWQSPDFQHNWPLELWIALILFAALVRGWRLPWTRAAMLLVLLHMTLQHARFAEVLGVVAPLVAAPALGPQLGEPPGSGPEAPTLDRVLSQWAKPASAWGVAITALVLVAISAIALHREIDRQADGVTPAAALAAVAGKHIEGPVLNDYSFGGYLIFAGIKPFIDGRYLYGEAFTARYVKATMGSAEDELARLLNEYHIAWTLLAPTTPANSLLARMRGWKRFYGDDIAVVYVREASAVSGTGAP